jgi:hypothetical protein
MSSIQQKAVFSPSLSSQHQDRMREQMEKEAERLFLENANQFNKKHLQDEIQQQLKGRPDRGLQPNQNSIVKPLARTNELSSALPRKPQPNPTPQKIASFKGIDNALKKARGYDFAMNEQGKGVFQVKGDPNETLSLAWVTDSKAKSVRTFVDLPTREQTAVDLSFKNNGKLLVIRDDEGRTLWTALPLTIKVDKDGLATAYVGKQSLEAFVSKSPAFKSPVSK